MIEPIDLARLKDLFSDNEPDLYELLRATAYESEKVFHSLSEAVSQHDAQSAAAEAHKLKGFASNVGAGQAAELSARIENEIAAQCWQSAAVVCVDLDTEVKRIVAFVNKTVPAQYPEGT